MLLSIRKEVINLPHFYFYTEKKKKGKKIEAHLLAEEDFWCEDRGIARPNVYKRKKGSKINYMIELDGVRSKREIDITLESGDILSLQAKPSKEVMAHSLCGLNEIKEYQVNLRLPTETNAEDINAEYDEEREVLTLTIRKPKKKEKIEIK